ncbi:membrane protein [Roseivirga seohaensis subsp. aquiponti]|uniref:Membrane protein n=1 Tax=Roseivirga seohaensis subsp. aquiponti TaxID=1566026 RepID=A0A0L8AJ73_9BACT|nr:TerC family protein [Roseivirga seohaensis]KOF02493.1 membrane protein [Roseivirga seohaensis subsp. aquiponti]
MEALLTSEGLVALLTLTFLEVILGVDNIIFISIVSNRLPEADRKKTRNLGLGLALIMRIGLLLGISWIIGFTEPLFTVLEHDVSIKDLILILGGLFLIGKSTTEIHHTLEGDEHQVKKSKGVTVSKVILQTVALDIVFSFDSILTAVGLTDQITIMIIAVTLAMIVMMSSAGKISAFINKHPSLQMLAMSFLILIGFMLVLEGIGEHIEKGYIYFAVFFSLAVEALNMRKRSKDRVVKLRKRIVGEE